MMRQSNATTAETSTGLPVESVVNSPLQFTTSTGATRSFPNLYADIKNISWLFGGAAWAGTPNAALSGGAGRSCCPRRRTETGKGVQAWSTGS